MTSTPSALVGSPEGIALLKMQHELAAATANFSAHGDTSVQPEARKLMLLRRSLDSIAADFARSLRDGDVSAEQKHFGAGGERERVEMRLRELEPQVRIMIRQSGPLPMRAQRNAIGYLGVAMDALHVSSVIDGEMRVGYCTYPVVESVDPGSPAEKGGLLAGDTLLAYNGHDLRESDINISQLLVPGKTVRVTYRRGGRSHEIPMTVGQRPDSGQAVFITKFTCAPEETRPGCDVSTSRNYSIRMRVAADFPVTLLSNTPGAESALFLEARVLAISEEIAASTGGSSGLLVMNVPAGSRAGESGLHLGDLITEVNGVPVRDIIALQRALLKTGTRAATLQIMNRKAGARSLDVRW